MSLIRSLIRSGIHGAKRLSHIPQEKQDDVLLFIFYYFLVIAIVYIIYNKYKHSKTKERIEQNNKSDELKYSINFKKILMLPFVAIFILPFFIIFISLIVNMIPGPSTESDNELSVVSTKEEVVKKTFFMQQKCVDYYGMWNAGYCSCIIEKMYYKFDTPVFTNITKQSEYVEEFQKIIQFLPENDKNILVNDIYSECSQLKK